MNHNIILIGMPGSGKTTFGKTFAKQMNASFCDMDHLIEEQEKMEIAAIFAQYGESYFRQLESNCCVSLQQCDAVKTNNAVISTGGGVILRIENMEILKSLGLVVFLNRPVDLILATSDLSDRPLLAKDRERIHKLYRERIGLYKQYCDIEIKNRRGIPEAIAKLEKQLT